MYKNLKNEYQKKLENANSAIFVWDTFVYLMDFYDLKEICITGTTKMQINVIKKEKIPSYILYTRKSVLAKNTVFKLSS